MNKAKLLSRGPFILVILFAFAAFSRAAFAQVATGSPAFGSFSGGPDVINLGNLNSHIAIPVIHKAGRGTNFTYDLTYDSSVWYPVGSSGSQSWQPVTNWGWAGQTQVALGYVTYFASNYPVPQACQSYVFTITKYSNWIYHDAFGVQHAFPSLVVYYIDGDPPKCNGLPETGSSTTSDGSGLTLNADSGPDATIVSRDGSKTMPPLETGTGAGTFTDRNGNEITAGSSGAFTDTLGTTALTVSGSAPNPVKFTYTNPSNSPVSVTVTYKLYTVKTNFNCSGVAEFGPTSESLVDKVTLPDGSFYQFNYEPTPGFSGDYTGRLASVQFPTGGTISYQYLGGNNGIECADGSTAGIQRTTPDGTWTYARSGSPTALTTTITDPTSQANQTVIVFAELANNFYETGRSAYSGASNGGTLLRTVTTCYSSQPVGCQAPTSLPITERRLITVLPGGLQSQSDITYNSNGLATGDVESDYGLNVVGSVLANTAVSYASLGNGIADRPSLITIKNGSGAIVAQSAFTYDSGTPAPTSGTPQHVAISGSRGNLTSVSRLVQGSSTLTNSFTYFDTGNVQTATDVNGASTTYNYPDSTSTCGNAFPISVSKPLGLSKSMAWNCTGGVQISVTDENGKTVSATYSDAYFWRINSTADAEGNNTTLSYANPSSLETTLLFNNGNSAVDVVKTLDGLSRTLLTQTRQSPNGSQYDSVETDHDSAGRRSRTTMPYSGSKGQNNGSGPAMTQTYDALNRPIVATDGDGGTVTLSYSANDVLRQIGPKTSGENLKQRQSEYNSIGKLTSVCEVTAGTQEAPAGTCGQTTTATGYWTKYTYDAIGNLLSATQNAQSSSSQSRSYAYDGLRRMTSETNPETGTINYVYDSDSTCGISDGDLVKKTDAAGNVTCYTYDALHHVTSITYPSGPNSSNTPSKHFVYGPASGSVTVDGVAMANAKGRLAEAYTCVSPCSSKKTDEGFSYTARGEVSDVYESTPDSGSYFHVSELYWANGAVNQISGLSGLPALTYGVDGEGRSYSVSASSGQNPVSGTSYSVASEATQVNLGSGDNDKFQFDSNTSRMTQYQFNVNSQSVTGALTWNANGTLGKLAIADAFNSANTQTCTYSYDDLARLASGNCGSVWSQTFSYDAFGNITKSGSESFQPGYNYQTNQMSSGASYDSNGEVLSDSLHSYTWDAMGRPTTIDTVTFIYDALGRMVERSISGTNTEIVYDCLGNKLALMNGTSILVKGFAPLPGGATAVYNSSGLQYYRHPDWLGSSRFASTPNTPTQMYNDLSNAPFGEQYAQSVNTGITDTSFAGMNEDTATNLYDAQFREYEIYGRWPSPDPAGIAAANPANPQSWNRYAYVMNNPLRAIDPLGLDCVLIYEDGALYDDPNIGEDQCGNLFKAGNGLVGVWVDNAPGTTISGGWDANGVLVLTYTNGSGNNTYGTFDTISGTFSDPYGNVLFNANNYFGDVVRNANLQMLAQTGLLADKEFESALLNMAVVDTAYLGGWHAPEILGTLAKGSAIAVEAGSELLYNPEFLGNLSDFLDAWNPQDFFEAPITLGGKIGFIVSQFFGP